ncbi:MAG: hypothetical protein AB7P40_00075 [Chloroflexota bacterium]
MRIVTVEYRRLRTYGGYQNETVGAVAQVDDGEDAETALAKVRTWVNVQLGSHEDERVLAARVESLRWEAESAENRLARANEKWAALIAFLDKLGIERPSEIPETLEGLPF